ncbi:MAG: response regulator transcription factor [Saprospiraceae bacterium]|nr:response regulator transcription factor [Saprospiraceae bacterium]
MKPNPSILLVEDDLSMGFLLSEYLESEGLHVKLCRDGASGLDSFRRGSYDLCILDVMMPKMDGFTLARQLRAVNPEVPFFFLTARSLKNDKLKGFDLGAEDYITKPFDEEELLCRIRVMLRRQAEAQQAPTPKNYTIGAYEFDYSRQELSRHDETWRLTEKENEVLRLLCLHQNQILRRDDAVEQIYGKRDYFLGRSFDVFISRLRKLLQNDPNVTIENVYKVGFILSVKSNDE